MTARTIAGTVTNAVTGAAIANVRIKLESGSDEPGYARSNDNGRFIFPNVAAGSYTLRAECPGFLKADAIRGDKASRSEVSLMLVPYAVISGKVTDPDGLPIEDSNIEVMVKRSRPASGGDGMERVPLQVKSNDLGEFRIAPLEPGTYVVIANKPFTTGAWESNYRITYYPRALDLASAKPLVLAAGQQVRADIQILRRTGVRIAGRLIKPAGAEGIGSPYQLTSVAMVPDPERLTNSSSGPFAIAKDDYEFHDVLPGKYTLTAVTQDAWSDPTGVNRKALFGLSRTIEVGERDMDGTDLRLEPVGDIPGIVKFRASCTPTRVSVHGFSRSPLGAGDLEAASGADGRFVLRGVSPGRYILSVTPVGGNGIGIAVSIRAGDRDLSNSELDLPLASGEGLEVTIDCMPSGGNR